MPKRKDLTYGVKVVKNNKVKVKDKRGGLHEYSCMIVTHNYSDNAYYTVNYETGMSWNSGEGKEYARYKTKAAAQKGLTAMKTKLRKKGHPFSK